MCAFVFQSVEMLMSDFSNASAKPIYKAAHVFLTEGLSFVRQLVFWCGYVMYSCSAIVLSSVVFAVVYGTITVKVSSHDAY